MRRTDRLFELMLQFRDGRLVTGAALAAATGVSLRTIYRDVETLMAAGFPVEGARGVGYVLRTPVFLPPLTLTLAELEALHLGMSLVAGAGDPELAAAAGSLRAKLDAVLPEDRPRRGGAWPAVSELRADPGPAGALEGLRRAIRAREVVTLDYLRLDGTTTSRDVRPLELELWGRVWTLAAWCELRGDFRTFRVDRLRGWRLAGRRFRPEPGRRIEDYRARAAAEAR
jgi:predicted DNA-binding transcriptional regulator YafY